MPPSAPADIHKDICTRAEAEIAAAQTQQELEQRRIEYLGKNGTISLAMRQISNLPAAERPAAGSRLQQLRRQVQQQLDARLLLLQDATDAAALAAGTLDVSLPGRALQRGSRHPISRLMDEITDWFTQCGYARATGPEIEDTWHNFTALNMGDDHPARDMHDTFYLSPSRQQSEQRSEEYEQMLLRTHTSPVQIRSMIASPPPLHIICPGRVYRRDSDLTHTPMFHQVEGLVVDKNTNFAQLKGTLRAFLEHLFGAGKPLRFRASFFPFTEPSAEVDVQCFACAGDGCRICGDGWLEVLGAGMVHPAVLRNCELDPEQWSGFAFGFGVERLAMLLYGLDDMRLCYENDLRLLRQF